MVREVLIIRFGALGDLVLATVLLDALGSDGTRSRVTWVTKEKWGDLLAGDPRIDELVLLGVGESAGSLTRRLAPRYDLVLDAHANLRSRLLCARLDAVEFRRLEKDTLARWLYRHGAPAPRALQRRLLDRYLELVDQPGTARPRIHTPPVQRRANRVAIAIGAAHQTKRWPADRYAELARRLAGDGRELTVIGGPGEEELVALVAADPGTAWDARRPLGELAEQLASCAVVVGNDSGLLHLAEAVGTPVVALFGPTVREWGYFPWRENSRVLEHELECRPCSKMGEKPCRLPEKLCLTRTSVADVHTAVQELLHEPA